VRIPSVVLVELYRGRGVDEPVDALLPPRLRPGRDDGCPDGSDRGTSAGRGRGRKRDAVDAIVVATAIRLGGDVVMTHDPDDLRRLTAGAANVSILEI
jgi:hypothetical protein